MIKSLSRAGAHLRPPYSAFGSTTFGELLQAFEGPLTGNLAVLRHFRNLSTRALRNSQDPRSEYTSIRSGGFARFGAHLGGHGDLNELEVVGRGDLLVR